METHNKITALVIGKKNKEVYQYLDGDVFKNLTRGRSGKLKPEDAQKLFVIPIQLNLMAERNPNIIDLISTLGMSLEDYSEEEKIEFLKNNK